MSRRTGDQLLLNVGDVTRWQAAAWSLRRPAHIDVQLVKGECTERTPLHHCVSCSAGLPTRDESTAVCRNLSTGICILRQSEIHQCTGITPEKRNRIWRKVYTKMIAQVNSALHPSGIAKSSTSFGWGKVTASGWQITLCDPIWHLISRSGGVTFKYELLSLFHLLTYLGWTQNSRDPMVEKKCRQKFLSQMQGVENILHIIWTQKVIATAANAFGKMRYFPTGGQLPIKSERLPCSFFALQTFKG